MSASLLAALLVLLAFALLARYWPEEMPRSWVPLLMPTVALVLAQLVVVAHPGASVREAAALAAGRADPYLLLAPQEYQRATETRTAEMSGVRVPLPHSPALRLLALPMAPLLGDQGAVLCLALFAVSATVLLGFPLARDLGLGTPAALGLQLLLVALPGWPLALAGGAYPGLLGMAAGTLLVAHLVRRLDHLEGARDAAAACLFFAVALSADGGAVLPVTLFAVMLAAWEQATGDWRRSLRILGAWAVALALVAILLYGPFLLALVQELVPGIRLQSPTFPGAAVVVWAAVGPWLLLAVAGAPLPGRGRPRPRRVAWVAVAAGLLLVVLRTAVRWPGMAPADPARGEALFLVAPLAALAVHALDGARTRSVAWKAAAAVVTLGASLWTLRAAFAS
jgi:hypothetical protein